MTTDSPFSSAVTPVKPTTPRGERRVRSMLEAAIDVFIENGYDGTSLEKVIARSGGSRTTIYNAFGNKERLFTAAVQMMVDDVYNAYMAKHKDTNTVSTELFNFGYIFLRGITTPRAIAAARLIYGNAHRCPELGIWFSDTVFARVREKFAGVLAKYFPDIPFETLLELSNQYMAMLKGALFQRALCVPGFTPTSDDIITAVDHATGSLRVLLDNPLDLTC